MDRLRTRLGTRAGARLYDRVRQDRGATHRLDLPVMVAWALALAIDLVAVGLFVLGVGVIVATGFSIAGVIVGLVVLLVAWLMRPRFLPWPEDEALASRDRMPALFHLVDRVAGAVHAQPVDRIYLTSEYNASFARYGWRQRSGLRLGLPLFAALQGQERVAVLGHEIAHDVNGDPARGFVVGSAIRSAWELYRVLHPTRLVPARAGLVEMAAVPFVLIQAGIAEAVWLLLFVLVQASSQQSQRAEYRADILGAQVAGRAASMAMTERLHVARSVAGMTMLSDMEDPLGAIVSKVRGTPERELERIRRVERLQGSRLDYSHPPTVFRVGLIESLEPRPPLVELDATTSAQIDEELEPLRPAIGREIVARHARRIGA